MTAPGLHTALLVSLCDRPDGASIADVMQATGAVRHTVNCRLGGLTRSGVLLVGGFGWSRRYFSSLAARDAWVDTVWPNVIAAKDEARRAAWRAQDRKRLLERKGGIWQQMVDFCAVPGGRSHAELVAAGFGSSGTIGRYCSTLQDHGRLFKGGRKGKYQYFGIKAHRDAYEAKHAAVIALSTDEFRKLNKAAKRSGKPAKPRASSNWNDKPITKAPPPPKPVVQPIVPPGLKVTVCQHGVDTRFTADPSIAGRGVISQDYFARRQQERA